MYTVPKLDDYSPEALDRAVADLFAALDCRRSIDSSQRIRLEDIPRPLAGAQERRPHAGQRHLAEGRARPAKREVGQRVNELQGDALEAAIEEPQTKISHASICRTTPSSPPTASTSPSPASSAPSASSIRCCA